jgi:DNA gyrase subunit A
MSLVDGGKGITTEERDAYLRQSRALRLAENAAEGGEEETAPADEAAAVTSLSPERFKELQDKEEFVLTVASSGFGKRTSAYEYRVTGRGGKGVELMSLGRANQGTAGQVVAAFPVLQSDQIMLVTDGGTLIRCPVDGIRIAGRATRGVRIVNVSEGERVVSAIRIGEDDAGNGNGNGHDPSETNGG